MHPAFNRYNTGSTPVVPMFFKTTYPCSPIGRGAKLRPWSYLVLVRSQSGVFGDIAGMKKECLEGLISLTSVGATPTPATKITASVAQLIEQLTCNQ
jgi:hypothetical protein